MAVIRNTRVVVEWNRGSIINGLHIFGTKELQNPSLELIKSCRLMGLVSKPKWPLGLVPL